MIGTLLHADGGTAGTLIGLIFVVITLGMDHAKDGDTAASVSSSRPILVYFASLLICAGDGPAAPGTMRRCAGRDRLRRTGLRDQFGVMLASAATDGELLGTRALRSSYALGDLGGGVGAQSPFADLSERRRSCAARHRASQELGGHACHRQSRETRDALALAGNGAAPKSEPRRLPHHAPAVRQSRANRSLPQALAWCGCDPMPASMPATFSDT